jgi:DivIVA domain-containing protein
MTMTESDVQLVQRLNGENIRRRRFAYAKRGYDPDQVREYLERVADEVERLERDASQAHAEADTVARGARTAREDAYGELAGRIADVLRTADHHAEEVKRLAAEEAERMLIDARSEAERVRLEADGRAAQSKREGEEVLRLAREEAERMLQGLATRRDAILSDLQTMRERLVGVVENLETTMETQEPLVVPEPSAEPIGAVGAFHLANGEDPPSTDSIDLMLPNIPLIDLEDDEDEGEPADA